jgi:hypothetical protein
MHVGVRVYVNLGVCICVCGCVCGGGVILKGRNLSYFDRLPAAFARKKELTVFLAFSVARVDAVLITLGVCSHSNSGLGRLCLCKPIPCR